MIRRSKGPQQETKHLSLLCMLCVIFLALSIVTLSKIAIMFLRKKMPTLLSGQKFYLKSWRLFEKCVPLIPGGPK